MAEYDVIVVGGGNAAFCAALAAQEQGAKVVVLEAAPEDEAGGNSRFTAGSIRVVYNGVDDIKTLVPDLTDEGDRGDRLRHLHRREILRRHGAGDAEPRQPGSRRASGHAQLRHAELDAREGRALHPDLRPPGVQDRRQVQVLGRADGGIRRRRARPRADAHGRGQEARHRDPLPDARARRSSTPATASRACACATTARKARSAARRWCSRPAVSRPIRNGARAISAPAGTSPRCAAPASTPATASAWRSRSAPRRAATGRAATRCSGR